VKQLRLQARKQSQMSVALMDNKVAAMSLMPEECQAVREQQQTGSMGEAIDSCTQFSSSPPLT
jgi:hypothetical protein